MAKAPNKLLAGNKPPAAGRGRPKGAVNKTTAKREAEIAASGLTPLDYMLGVLRDEGNSIEARMDAAKAAAPYVHKRMPQAVDLGSDPDRPMLHRIERTIVDPQAKR